MSLTRAQIEQMPLRGTFGFSVESAEELSGGEFRVRGVMNSFRVMRSGRVLHPDGYVEWARGTPGARLPMLANHGYSGGFSTIGVWDEFDYDPTRGAVWSGTVGSGTVLADEARTLLAQRLLRGLSWSWITLAPARWITTKEADLDPHFREALALAGLDEAYAFWRYEPIEGSIVDVADDRYGLLAAGLDAASATVLAAQMDALRSTIAGAAATADEAALSARIEAAVARFATGLSTRLAEVVEAVLTDRDASYARALLADSGDGSGHGDEADDTVLVSERALKQVLESVRTR